MYVKATFAEKRLHPNISHLSLQQASQLFDDYANSELSFEEILKKYDLEAEDDEDLACLIPRFHLEGENCQECHRPTLCEFRQRKGFIYRVCEHCYPPPSDEESLKGFLLAMGPVFQDDETTNY